MGLRAQLLDLPMAKRPRYDAGSKCLISISEGMSVQRRGYRAYPPRGRGAPGAGRQKVSAIVNYEHFSFCRSWPKPMRG